MKHVVSLILFISLLFSNSTHSKEKVLYRPEIGKSLMDYKTACNENAYFGKWNEYIRKDGRLTSYSKDSIYEPKPITKLKKFDNRFIDIVDKVRTFSMRATKQQMVTALGKL